MKHLHTRSRDLPAIQLEELGQGTHRYLYRERAGHTLPTHCVLLRDTTCAHRFPALRCSCSAKTRSRRIRYMARLHLSLSMPNLSVPHFDSLEDTVLHPLVDRPFSEEQ